MADLGEGADPIWLATAEWLGNPVEEATASDAVATGAEPPTLDGGGKATGISDARRRGEIAFEPPLVGTVVKQPERETPAVAKTRQRTDTTARTRDMGTPIGFCLGNRCFDDAASVTAPPQPSPQGRTHTPRSKATDG